MKKETIFILEGILASSKTEGMSFSDTKAVIKQYNLLKPVAQKIKDDIQEAVERLKDDNIREIEQALLKHNESVAANKTEGILSQGIIDVYNKHYTAYLKKVTDFEKELLEEDVDMEIMYISESGVEKLVMNNNLLIDKASVLMEVFGNENN